MPEEAKAGVKARHRVVERGHNGLNRFRCLVIRWYQESENCLAMLHLACALIAFEPPEPAAPRLPHLP